MTQSSCKRDTKSKSHPSVKLAPVRVFSCKHPLRNHDGYSGENVAGKCMYSCSVFLYRDYFNSLTLANPCCGWSCTVPPVSPPPPRAKKMFKIIIKRAILGQIRGFLVFDPDMGPLCEMIFLMKLFPVDCILRIWLYFSVWFSNCFIQETMALLTKLRRKTC